MIDGLYNVEFFMPDEVLLQVPSLIKPVRYTSHAIQKAQERNICLPKLLRWFEVVEADVHDGIVTKMVVKIPYDDFFNVFLCIGFLSDDECICMTVWKSEKRFKASLDRTRYVTA